MMEPAQKGPAHPEASDVINNGGVQTGQDARFTFKRLISGHVRL